MSHAHTFSEFSGDFYCDCRISMTPSEAVATLTAERDQLIEELAGCHCGRSMVHKACVAERDKLLEDIKDRDRTYLAVQRAEGLERDRLAAEVARQRRINDGWAEEHAKRMAEMARQSRFWGALEETAARLEAHQHIMCSECEGIRLFVASALDAEAWE